MSDKFRLDNFKKWMKDHQEIETEHSIKKPENPLIGIVVESKITSKKLIDKMVSESQDLSSLADEFTKNGGRVVAVDGKDFTIEVDGGEKFTVHRAYVTRA